MFEIYEVIDECHGNIGYYANLDKAKLECCNNAKDYEIDNTTPLDYDGVEYWGWELSYVHTIKVVE